MNGILSAGSGLMGLDRRLGRKAFDGVCVRIGKDERNAVEGGFVVGAGRGGVEFGGVCCCDAADVHGPGVRGGSDRARGCRHQEGLEYAAWARVQGVLTCYPLPVTRNPLEGAR